MSENYNSTCLSFDLDNEDERICYEIFREIGRKWKPFLLTILTLRFPEYFKSGIVSGELEDLIREYSKKFNKKRAPHPVFLGWHSKDYPADYSADVLLNIHLKGGAKDFIVLILKESLPFRFKSDKTEDYYNE